MIKNDKITTWMRRCYGNSLNQKMKLDKGGFSYG